MNALETALKNEKTVRALVAGDLILDRYVEGDVGRINPEAPVPVVQAAGERFSLGGAANTARNLKVLGCDVDLFGVAGDDPEGRTLREALRDRGIDPGGVVLDPARPTTKKTRVISRGQHLIRVDWEKTGPLDAEVETRLVRALAVAAGKADVVVVSDYGKGLLTPRILSALLDAGAKASIPVLVDPKGRDFVKYAGATLLTPNRGEVQAWSGRLLDDETSIREALEALKREISLQVAVVTLGSGGLAWVDEKGNFHRIRAEAREVFDVTGAGDTVMATLACFIGAGVPLADALRLANIAGGIAVGRLGTTAVSRSEIFERVLHGSGSPGAKVVARADLPALLEARRDRGETVVFTNGCFDILHRGHVEYLRFCRRQGDVLVVGLNDDRSVRALKGAHRPVNPGKDRAAVLAALASVDLIVFFDEETPEAIIREAEPDVLVKGEDWREKGVVGRAFVEGRGGTVVLAPLTPGFSTSELIEKLRKDP